MLGSSFRKGSPQLITIASPSSSGKMQSWRPLGTIIRQNYLFTLDILLMREGHLCCKTASLGAVQFFSQMVINRGSFWTKLEGCQGKELAEKIYVLLSLFLVCKLEVTSRQFRAGRSAVLTIGTDRHSTSPS